MKVVVIILFVALIGFAAYELIFFIKDLRNHIKAKKEKKQKDVNNVSTETTKDEVDRKE